MSPRVHAIASRCSPLGNKSAVVHVKNSQYERLSRLLSRMKESFGLDCSTGDDMKSKSEIN